MITSESIARAFSALANRHRVDILKLLLAESPAGLTAGDIAARSGLAPSTLAHHLREMETGGVITRTQVGRTTMVHPCFDALNRIVSDLTQLCCAGAAAMPSETGTPK